jgi:hypothetical protein
VNAPIDNGIKQVTILLFKQPFRQINKNIVTTSIPIAPNSNRKGEDTDREIK